MRKTFQELIEEIRKPTTHYADQDFIDTDIEKLLMLIRQNTIEECIQAATLEEESLLSLPKDSIEV